VTLSITQQGTKFLARDPINVLADAIDALDEDGKTRFRDALRHILDQSDTTQQRRHADICRRCMFLKEGRANPDSKTSTEFTCRLFRAEIAEADIESLCASFEHRRQ
jgi:hypothetical protein